MTAPQWHTIFRKSAAFQAMTRLLDEAEIAWTVERGGKHPHLVFEVDGRRHKHVISTSPSDPEAYRLAERDIRRILRAAEINREAADQEQVIGGAVTGGALCLEFEGRQTRVIERNGEAWFSAADVARELGYREAHDLTRLLDLDEKGPHSVRTLGGVQEITVISEPGLYRAITQRRATKAIPPETREGIARFQRWVFHDVLPSIRKHGAYAADPALMRKIEEMAAELAEVRVAADLALEAAGRIEAGKVSPTVDFASTVTSDDLISMAGIKPGDRVRGTSAMVTGRMLTFTAGHDCFKTPAHLNPSMPWRFPREKGTGWLFGPQLGAEQIRSQIERQRRKKAQRNRPPHQGHLTLVGAP